MDNRKIAAIIVIMVTFILITAALIGISGHIPFIGKVLTLIFALILLLGIVLIFAYATRRGKK
ncbi:MAG: hypothetical protein IJ851_00730 [Eubacterium sp.]|nr:hypothetical protein [Eubacterium sp.]